MERESLLATDSVSGAGMVMLFSSVVVVAAAAFFFFVPSLFCKYQIVRIMNNFLLFES